MPRPAAVVIVCALGGAPVSRLAAGDTPARTGAAAHAGTASANAGAPSAAAGAPSAQPPAAPPHHRSTSALAGRGKASAAPPASARKATPARPAPARATGPRARVVAAARRHLGGPPERDCSSFVQRVFREAEVRLALTGPAGSASEALWRGTRVVKSPRPGDLAFFHDTYDRDGDGAPGDRFTHVAIVERVDGRAVTLIHRGSRGIARVRMDLAHPSDGARNGALRQRRRDDPPATRYLAGQLLAGFGAPPALDGRGVAARAPAATARVSSAR